MPGILVDYVVVAGEHPHHHSMTFGEYFNPAYTGLIPRVAATARAPPPNPSRQRLRPGRDPPIRDASSSGGRSLNWPPFGHGP